MLQLAMTDAIRQLLVSASQMESLSADVVTLAKSCLSSDTISWSALQTVCKDLREHPSRDSTQPSPWLVQACQGSRLKFTSPPTREKSPELQQRLLKLQDQLENQQYHKMVADITTREREAEEQKDAILPTFRLQSSFGVHVIVTMGALYAFGYYVVKLSFQGSEAAAALTGALAMTFGMLLETLLFIIRSNRPQPLAERYPHLLNPRLGPKIGPHSKARTTSNSKNKKD